MNKLLVSALAIMFLPIIAIAEITPNDVSEKMKAGDISTAEIFTKQILRDHPNSAKAHYYMGQILATEGNYKDGYKELKEAANLDKSLSFASSPDRFREEMNKVEVNLEKSPAPAISNDNDHSFPWGWILFIVSIGSAIYYWFFIRTKPKPDSNKQTSYKPNPTPPSPSSAQVNKPSPVSQTLGSNYSPYASYYPQPPIVNNYNSSNNDGFVTGMILGSVLSEHNHGNTIIDRETVIERNTTNNFIERDDSSYIPKKTSFDSGNDNSSSFDSGSSSFDSGSSSFDSGSSDSSW